MCARACVCVCRAAFHARTGRINLRAIDHGEEVGIAGNDFRRELSLLRERRRTIGSKEMIMEMKRRDGSNQRGEQSETSANRGRIFSRAARCD